MAFFSGPSVPKELETAVPEIEVPFIPIIEKGGPCCFQKRKSNEYDNLSGPQR
jgi:hypothetical protein